MVQVSKGEQITLRITIHDEPDAVKLQLEGTVVGPWVREFDRTWRGLASALESKKLVVDLCGVLHMDSEARRILAEIYKQTGADLLANTPMTEYFAEDARRRSKKS
jgi:anti-anti-sigma regulatory factor